MSKQIKEPVILNDKCPYCGSEKRLIKEYVEELRGDGDIGPDAFQVGAGQLQLNFVDQTLARYQLGQPVAAPAMQIAFDICGNEECHKLYPVKVTYEPQLTVTGTLPVTQVRKGRGL